MLLLPPVPEHLLTEGMNSTHSRKHFSKTTRGKIRPRAVVCGLPWSLTSLQKVAIRADTHVLLWLPAHVCGHTAASPCSLFLQAPDKGLPEGDQVSASLGPNFLFWRRRRRRRTPSLLQNTHDSKGSAENMRCGRIAQVWTLELGFLCSNFHSTTY